MSQERVYNLLKKNKKPMCYNEISKKLKLAQSVCCRNLKDLTKWGDIKYEKRLIDVPIKTKTRGCYTRKNIIKYYSIKKKKNK